MTVDGTTEIIAHFIGQFDLAVEAPRLQIVYDPFTLERVPEELASPEPAPPVEVVAPYTVRPYDGSVTLQPAVTAPDALAGTLSSLPVDVTVGAGTAAALPPAPFALPLAAGAPGAAAASSASAAETLRPELPTPNAIATWTTQSLVLSDDDLIGATGAVAFAPLAPLHADLAAVGALGDRLSDAVVGDLATAATPGHAAALALNARIEAAAPPALAGLEATVLRGAHAQGIVVDGAAADALPDFREHLPEPLREDDGEDDTAPAPGDVDGVGGQAFGGGTATPGTAVAGAPVAGIDERGDGDAPPPEDAARDPFEAVPGGAGSGDAADPGNEVVTGANLAVNEAAIAWQWLDAPVFVVQGDVVDLDVVVQHNLLRDRDTPPGETGAPAGRTAPTATAAPSAEAGPPGPVSTTPASPKAAAAGFEPGARPAEPAPSEAGEASGQPSEAINAARIAATSTADDAGSASPGQPSGSVVKTVTGDLALTNTVEQHNFVTDMDRADVTLTGSETSIGTGGNVTVNEAFFTELGYRFDLIVVDGDMIKLDVINQLNVLLDDDITSGPPGAAGPISAHDNLVMNLAEVTSHGVDTVTAMREAFAATAEQLRAGASALTDEVLADRLLAGKDLVATLHVHGDLTIANMIDQRTYLGDQDQVHLARDAMAAAQGAPLEVTTGANALLNAATITEHGVDSQIMAGGDVYDDALLYQAGLIDTDAQPGAVDLPALANEAVAFLADGFTTPAAPDLPEAHVTADSGPVPADLMQTMLA